MTYLLDAQPISRIAPTQHRAQDTVRNVQRAIGVAIRPDGRRSDKRE